MSKILSQAQLEQYRRDGYAFPVPALGAEEVRDLRADLECWEAQQGHPLDYPERSKSYLLYRWADIVVQPMCAGTRTAPISSSIRWST
jgi:hypothetical protein